MLSFVFVVHSQCTRQYYCVFTPRSRGRSPELREAQRVFSKKCQQQFCSRMSHHHLHRDCQVPAAEQCTAGKSTLSTVWFVKPLVKYIDNRVPSSLCSVPTKSKYKKCQLSADTVVWSSDGGACSVPGAAVFRGRSQRLLPPSSGPAAAAQSWVPQCCCHPQEGTVSKRSGTHTHTHTHTHSLLAEALSKRPSGPVHTESRVYESGTNRVLIALSCTRTTSPGTDPNLLTLDPRFDRVRIRCADSVGSCAR